MPGHVDFSKFQNRNRSFLAHFYIYAGKYHDFWTDSDTDLRIYIYAGLYICRETPVCICGRVTRAQLLRSNT